jgi:hypothetical protein
MNDLNKALSDISSIRRQVAHSTEFRGYGPATLAGTGALAVAAAAAQAWWLPDPAGHIAAYLSIWISTAALSAALIGTEMHARTRRIHSGMADEMIRMAVEQFLPAVGRGRSVDAGAGALCAGRCLDDSRNVAGDLQPGRVFVVPFFAPRHRPGWSVVPAYGAEV